MSNQKRKKPLQNYMAEREIGDKLDDFYALMMSQLNNNLSKAEAITIMKEKFKQLFDGPVVVKAGENEEWEKVGNRFKKDGHETACRDL